MWRRLRRLGVAQLADGLVALPADARTREQLDWAAEEVRQAGGTAGTWIARPTSAEQEQQLAASMAAARAEEYAALHAEAQAVTNDPVADHERAVRQLRTELRRIRRRDFFPPPERDAATSAIENLARRDSASAVADEAGAS